MDEKIPSENELASMFQVSRTTVRQALSKLVTLGLIETKAGEGNYVKEINLDTCMSEMVAYIQSMEDSMEEMLEVRLVLEVETVGIACRKATYEDIIHLRKSLARMQELKDDCDRYVREDLYFHMLITKIVGNSMLTQMPYLVRDVIRKSMSTLTMEIGTENGLAYHKKLIAAMEKKMKRWLAM